MKLITSIPTFLTVIVVAGLIALLPLSPLPISAYSNNSSSPSAQPFTIDGTVSGPLTCEVEMPVSADIAVGEEEDGTLTGSVAFSATGLPPEGASISVNGGTTDGNTFSLSGKSGVCTGPFTIGGNCGTGVAVNYKDSGTTGAGGTFSGDVTCTLS